MERGSIFPSWRYHADGRSVLCLDAAQDAALGDDWSDKDIRQFEAVTVEATSETPIVTVPAPPTEPATEPAKKRGRPKKA